MVSVVRHLLHDVQQPRKADKLFEVLESGGECPAVSVHAHARPNVSGERPPLETKVKRGPNSRASTGAGTEQYGGGSAPLDCWPLAHA